VKKKHNLVEASSDSSEIIEMYVKASGFPEVNAHVVKKQTVKYKTFARMAQEYFSYHRVNFNVTDWTKSSCTCPFFQKQFVCKHIYGIAVVRGQCTFSTAAKSVPLGQKRKRGRPAGATKALIIQ